MKNSKLFRGLYLLVLGLFLVFSAALALRLAELRRGNAFYRQLGEEQSPPPAADFSLPEDPPPAPPSRRNRRRPPRRSPTPCPCASPGWPGSTPTPPFGFSFRARGWIIP